jgi:hypothetical protein
MLSAASQANGTAAASARVIIVTANRGLVAKVTSGGTWAAASRSGALVHALGR